MTIKVIIFLLVSGFAGIKRPIWGAIVGSILAPALSIIHMMAFDAPTVVMLAPFGFGFGLLTGVFFWNLFHDSEYNKQNEKTYFMGMTRNLRSGFIYTDEEEKNAKDNKRSNIK
jgi:hypothetical protein